MGVTQDMINLCDLPMNKKGIVEDLKCKGSLKRRLLDLGIVKGTVITPFFRSPSGDPTAFEIRGSLIALRKEDSASIKIKMR